MKKHIILSALTLMLALGMRAQTTTTLTVKTLKGDTYTYVSGENMDSLRVLDGIGIKVYPSGSTVSVDYLFSQVTYSIAEETTPPGDANINRNIVANDQGKNLNISLLELPRVSVAAHDFFIQKSTSDYGITYSIEWCGDKRANRWTAYELHAGNMASNVKRTDAFAEDPDIPAEYRTTLADYSGSGYSRGHLCPSADRLCSTLQNEQTFLLSNMQPQDQTHNGGVWATLEAKVRTWAEQWDTLYVVKAATIDAGNIKAYTSSGLIVPSYFYMALLGYKVSMSRYEALGVWSPHAGGSTTEYVTIDELEDRTGIDFFCNLPDAIENMVETVAHGNVWGVTVASGAKSFWNMEADTTIKW
jgi:endonuclease G